MSLFVGAVIGFVLGLIGAGGSVHAVPLLIILLGLPPQQAIGLSLGSVAICTVYGSLVKLKSGDIQWLPAIIYAVMGSLAAPFGNLANRQIDERVLMSSFSVLVLIIAIRMWAQASKNSQQMIEELTSANGKLHLRRHSVPGICIGAVLTGFLSGLFGVGGGFLIIPTLIFLTGISMKQAIATSLVIIAAVSSSGFVSFVLTGSEVDNGLLAYLALGGIGGMTIGVFVSQYICGPLLQKGFSVVMVSMAIFALTTQFL